MSEHDQQKIVVDWLEWHHVPFFSVPNGAALGRNAAQQMAKLKAEGLRKGAPDLVLITNPAIVIEMKDKGGRVSKEQREMHEAMRKAGWCVLVAYDADEAIKSAEIALGVKR